MSLRRIPPSVFSIVMLVAHIAHAQASSPRAGGVVSGVVFDNIAGEPLRSAIVQLAPADGASSFVGSTSTDSLGRYSIAGVPDGHYSLGFLHPVLDSLGVAPTLRDVRMVRSQPLQFALGTPSPAELRAAICHTTTSADTNGLVIGTVRNSRNSEPVGGAIVVGEWNELSFTMAGLRRRAPNLKATTGDNGWFALCNVPKSGAITLLASNRADSTDRVEINIPHNGLLRRDLFVGASRIVTSTQMVDTTSKSSTPGSAASPMESRTIRRHAGDGRISGTVVTKLGGQPLAGAQVRIAYGPETRANDRGEWTLVDVPNGTRMLEVRAVGYYPELAVIDVVNNARPQRIAMSTFKSVLDTVRVTANRGIDHDRAGFLERRRGSGTGRFLTQQEIAKHAPVFVSDVFKLLNGIRIEAIGDDSMPSQRKFVMRGVIAETCAPTIYIDGHDFSSLTADDVDNIVHVKEITGVEVYSSGFAPPQFQHALNECGAIVIWTR